MNNLDEAPDHGLISLPEPDELSKKQQRDLPICVARCVLGAEEGKHVGRALVDLLKSVNGGRRGYQERIIEWTGFNQKRLSQLISGKAKMNLGEIGRAAAFFKFHNVPVDWSAFGPSGADNDNVVPLGWKRLRAFLDEEEIPADFAITLLRRAKGRKGVLSPDELALLEDIGREGVPLADVRKYILRKSDNARLRAARQREEEYGTERANGKSKQDVVAEPEWEDAVPRATPAPRKKRNV